MFSSPDNFWQPESIAPSWTNTQKAWKGLIARFREYGILSNDLLPTEAALVTMVSLIDKFGDSEDFPFALYWFLQASRFGRYSGSATTSLEEDLRDIEACGSCKEAVQQMLLRFRHEDPLEPDDFLRDYADSRFGRFMLYLLIYRNEAKDWDEHGHRLGFEGLEALTGFRPQWHHVFPRKYLDGKVNDGLVDALANIAVIGPGINIRISDKDPMSYVAKYRISPDKLRQQFIEPTFVDVGHHGYEEWVKARAATLADAANAFLERLRS